MAKSRQPVGSIHRYELIEGGGIIDLGSLLHEATDKLTPALVAQLQGLTLNDKTSVRRYFMTRGPWTDAQRAVLLVALEGVPVLTDEAWGALWQVDDQEH
jgi:hypothetical protein